MMDKDCGIVKRSLFVLVLLFAAAGAFAQKSFDNNIQLDIPVEGTVPVGGYSQGASYNVRIPSDVFAITIRLSDAQADLDIVFSTTSGDVIDYSELLDFNEELFISRMTDPRLYTGQFKIDITYQYERAPVYEGEILEEIPFTLVVEAIRLDPSNNVEPGDRVEGHLLPSGAMTALYTTEVGADQDALRFDLSDTFGDLDLFVYYGSLEDDPIIVAETLRSTEQVVLTRTGSPALTTGTYYVLVVDQLSNDHPLDFTLNVSASEDAPSYLGRVPVIRIPSDPLGRALLSTVEIVTDNSGGGSGCLLTSDGYLITNWHVVAGPDGRPDPYLTVAMSLDHTIPPTELFHAEVVAYEEDRDLALLHITGDRYGRPLRRSLNLPHFEIETEMVSIGDPLAFIGYPWVGGTGSRASVTLTRGTVAGYQHNEFGTSFKTDGEINSGNSGGAAIDAEYRLVGLPSSVVGEDAGQLAYVIPIGVMPEVWLEIMGLE